MSSLFFEAGPAPVSGRKIMLATTAYDSPDASYTFSMARTREAMHAAGLPTAYLLLQGNCHVDDARNTVVRDFLASDCSDLVFLDADVSWEPGHLVALCGYDCDVVGGVYPYRRDGSETMPVRNLPDCIVPDENGLLEVEGLPTGFLRIRRAVLERLAEKAEYFTKDGDGPVPVLFERDIYNGGRRGGDIAFCMKWRAIGGRLYAATDLRLGHCGKTVIRDSLAANLRRRAGLSLSHVVERIKAGEETPDDYQEAILAVNNPWGAQRDTLSLAVLLARKARGPIIETGSGLTTVLMAAATDETVWCLEHSPVHAARLREMAAHAGVRNIALVTCPLREGWYAPADEDWAEMPRKFAVGLVDGPPRLLGDRMRFFDHFGDRVKVILADDADDRGYAEKLEAWAEGKGLEMRRDGRAAVILKRGSA